MWLFVFLYLVAFVSGALIATLYWRRLFIRMGEHVAESLGETFPSLSFTGFEMFITDIFNSKGDEQ